MTSFQVDLSPLNILGAMLVLLATSLYVPWLLGKPSDFFNKRRMALLCYPVVRKELFGAMAILITYIYIYT